MSRWKFRGTKANDEISSKYNLVFIEGYSAPLDINFCEDEITQYKKYDYNVEEFVVFITNLEKKIEEMWENVQRYTKKNVRRATKRGITIKELQTLEEAKHVFTLFQEWAKTKGLVVSNTEQQLKKFWECQNSGFEKTFLDFNEQQLIASITISYFNNIVVPIQVLNSYYSIARNLGGPALTWHAIQWSKKSKFLAYDITGGPLLPEKHLEKDDAVFELIHYKKKMGWKTIRTL